MSLRQHLQIIFHSKKLILVFSVLTCLGALGFSLVTPPRYGGFISFTINHTGREPTGDYQYDSYYALKAAELLGETVESWFSSPSFLEEIYGKAGIEPPKKEGGKLTKYFQAKKASPQYLEIKFEEYSQERTSKIAQVLPGVVRSNFILLNQTQLGQARSPSYPSGQSSFDIQASRYLIESQKPPFLFVGLAALIGGLMVGVLGAYLGYYLREEKNS